MQATEDAVDLAGLWSVVRDQWRFVLGIGASLLFVVMTLTLSTHMEFTAAGRLYLGELDARGKAAAASELDVFGASSGDVAGEIEILKSRSILLEAILSSGLNASIRPLDWSSPRLWRWLVSTRDLKLLEGAARVVSVRRAALPDGAREPQYFSVRFVSPRKYELYAEEKLIARGVLDAPFESNVAAFTLSAGSHGAPAPGTRFSLRIAPLQETVDDTLADLTVTAPRMGGGANEPVKVVTLEFAHRSPHKAAAFLARLMDTYLRERQSWKTADATAAESFVSEQLKSMRDTLDTTQQKLADYRSNTKLVVMDNEAKAMIEQMGKYEEQRVAARLQVAALSDIKRVLKGPNPPVEAYLLGETGDSMLNGLGRSLAEARQNLTDLQGRFHEAAPDVRNQKAQIAAQLESIRNYVTSRLARAQDSLGALNAVIGQFEERLRTVPGAELGLAQLSRESEVYNKLYSYMLERQQQAAIQKASTVSKNRVLDVPEVPRKESSPRLGLRLASGVIGILLGVLIVLLRRFFATTLQSDADVRTSLGSGPVLATVPRYLKPVGKGRFAAPTSALDGIAADATSPFAEAFRTLRTSLYHGGGGAPAGQVLLVTSPTPGDGKTTSTLALAAMLAADEKWVLVVDADLRKPSHHRLTGHDEDDGLRGILSGKCNWRDVVHPVSGQFGEFFSVGAGRLAPAELISSERMVRFLMDARSRYDFILVDAPSFPLVADPLVLAPLADGVLTIVRLGHTPRALAAEHVKRLSAAAHGHAVVVNGAPVRERYGYGGSYPAAQPQSLLSMLKLKLGARGGSTK